ncbi:MAG: hypothetical protein C0608_06600 [Deltaproteobacteria bacterium]|nr:MAG: hypothetical protein C0608_06600 [Deltaproteobacteria bacterium]
MAYSGVMATPEEISACVSADRRIGAISKALFDAGAGEAYLVGGSVRDIALKTQRELPDFDIALRNSSLKIAEKVAKALGGSGFALDEGERAYRVVTKTFEADLVGFRAEDIEGDLRGRDFTLNAMAVSLADGAFTDPLDGYAALFEGTLIPCSGEAMEADPLRILRAFRLGATHSLAISPALSGQIALTKGQLAPDAGRISPERIRDELFKLLGGGEAGAALRSLQRSGVLFTLFPFVSDWEGMDQGDYHSHDLLEHALRAAEEAVRVAGECEGWLLEHFSEELEQNISRRALFIFTAFFHDIGKPETRRVEPGGRVRFITHDTLGAKMISKLLESLRVGKRARLAAKRVVAGHMRLYGLANQERPTERSRLRFLRDLGEESPETALLALCDERATGDNAPALDKLKATAEEILELYRESLFAVERSEPLLRGREIVDILGVGEGVLVGELLSAVADAEERGDISTKEEALAFLRERLDTH